MEVTIRDVTITITYLHTKANSMSRITIHNMDIPHPTAEIILRASMSVSGCNTRHNSINIKLLNLVVLFFNVGLASVCVCVVGDWRLVFEIIAVLLIVRKYRH